MQLPNHPNVKDCCKVPDNLSLQEQKDDLTTYVCKVCQCKHRRLKVDPGKLGALLSMLGKKRE